MIKDVVRSGGMALVLALGLASVHSGAAHAQFKDWLKDKAKDAVTQTKSSDEPKKAKCAGAGNGTKTLIGVTVGGYLGKKAGGGDLATLGGAFLGGAVADMLSCEEQEEVSGAVAETLDENPDKESREVTTKSGGQTVTITPKKTTHKTKKATIRYSSWVNERSAKGMEVDGKYYRVREDDILYSDTITRSRTMKVLKKGETVHVMGRLKERYGVGPWGAVGIDGVLSGYVQLAVLEDASVPVEEAENSQTKPVEKEDPRKARMAALKKRQAEQKAEKDAQKTEYYTEEEVKEAEEMVVHAKLEEDNTKVKTTCRTVEVSVENESDTNTFCKTLDGVWTL